MAAKIIKYFLGILNDRTFLSSIEYFDFKNRYISIRKDFFNLCFRIVNSSEKILKPKKFGLILKTLFINRFTSVSSTNLKKFFDNKISNSYIDYLNVARHYSALLQDDKIDFRKFFKNYLNKRNFRFYEKKGFKYYQYIQNPQYKKINFESNSNQQQQQLVLDVPATIQNYNQIIESDSDSTTSEINDFINHEQEDFREFEDRQIADMYSLTTPTNHNTSDMSTDEYYYLLEHNIQSLPIPAPSDIAIDQLQDRIQYLTNQNLALESTPSGNFTNYDDVEAYFNNIERTVAANQETINYDVQAIIKNNSIDQNEY